ncbi:apolipoprotein A1/A4/E family protein [Candidatus Bipolaricaulota bacterium]|nr:apolipoprotein A1/A4/E family protein [Candidatus Bipolaricaulota bacterium]
MKTRSKNLIVATMILGLLTVGVAGLASGYGNENDVKEGVLEDTMHETLAKKIEMEASQLEELMDQVRESVTQDGDRPYRKEYLESLASRLDMNPDELESIMTSTRLEAIEKLEEQGEISSELAEELKERAGEFPFGYGGPNDDESRSMGRGQGGRGPGGSRSGRGDGSCYGPRDGTGNGPGNGKPEKDNRNGRDN